MLNGYDTPDPTPRVPLTGLDFNHRYPRPPFDKVKPVPAFSERIGSFIEREEAGAKAPRHSAFAVIPDLGIWRKMGHRTFYRLFGLHYIQHGPKKNGIQEAIDKAHSRVFIKDAIYPLNTGLTPKSGIFLEGETSFGTILRANANNLKLFSVGGALMNNMRFHHLGMDANGKTGLTGFDLNMSSVEASVDNEVFDIFFDNTLTGAFTTLVDMIGNEDSWLDVVYLPNTSNEGYGESYFEVHNGQTEIHRLIQSSPSGTTAGIHVMGQMVRVTDSVLNTLIIDNQLPGDFNTTGILAIDNCYLSNSQPANVPKIQMGTVGTQGVAVFIIALYGCRVGLANAGTFIKNGTARTFSITNLSCVDNHFLNLDASAVTWVKNTGGSSLTPGKQLFWSPGNFVSGTIANGDVVSGGFGTFNFQVPPAGWGLTLVPALPAGTGSGNAVTNKYPRPVRVYQVGMSGTHIIDLNGNDTALGVDPPFIDLNANGEKVYYATTKPSSWTWYGM